MSKIRNHIDKLWALPEKDYTCILSAEAPAMIIAKEEAEVSCCHQA